MFGPTIQGEGKGAGETVLFLRFAGCNKWSGRVEDKAGSQCPFCDTDFLGGEKLTASDIVRRLLELAQNYPVATLVISGGEPTLQLDQELASELARYFSLYLETNGSRDVDPDVLKYINHVCCSPKQSPAETKIKHIDSLKVLHPPVSPERSCHEFFSRDFISKHPYAEKFIQPVMDENYDNNIKQCLQVCYASRGVRLSIQLHKVIEVK